MAARKRAKGKAGSPPEREGVARFSVEGFKSLARQTIELGRLNVLIGANGSGKTALLEAIGLLGAAVSGRVDAGELKRRGVRPSAPRAFVTALAHAPATKIRLGAESFSGASYRVTLAPPSGEWPNLWSFEDERVEEGGEVVLRRRRDVAQLFSKGRRLPMDIPLHGSGIGASARALSLADSSALRDLFFTLSDAVIFDPKTPALRGLSAEPMEPLGLDGSWAIFRMFPAGAAPPSTALDGRRVVVQLRDEEDPETGGRYTFKRWRVTKLGVDGGAEEIELRADNPAFKARRFRSEDGDMRVLAELVEAVR